MSAPSQEVILNVDQLSRRFPGGMALQDVSFQLCRGEIVALVGLNGAGKTTLLRVLSTYLAPTSGSVTISGMDVVAQGLEIRCRIGYLPEQAPLYAEMRVSEFLSYRAHLKGLCGSEGAERVQDVVEQCQLDDIFHRIIAQLSNGQRQRVGFADCLLNQPDLLLLDEPFMGLDPKQSRLLHHHILGMAKGSGVLLSTHQLELLNSLCTRVLLLHGGRILRDCPVSQFAQEGASLEDTFLGAIRHGGGA